MKFPNWVLLIGLATISPTAKPQHSTSGYCSSDKTTVKYVPVPTIVNWGDSAAVAKNRFVRNLAAVERQIKRKVKK